MFTITIENESTVVANVYAPTQDHSAQQMELIDLLEDKIMSLESDHIVLGGDFNLCMDPDLDRNNPRTSTGQSQRTTYADRVDSFMDSLKLADAWRTVNPTSRRYTFRRGKYASRLDYFLIPEQLVNSQLQVDILTTPLSDHSMLCIKLGARKQPKGPGLWRFNNLLLAQEEFIAQTRATILDIKTTAEPTDPKKKWEWLKFRVAETARTYEKTQYRKDRNHEMSLAKRLEHISKSLDQASETLQNPAVDEEDLLHERDSIARELKELELSRANKTILRSNANWALNGERPTKYFLNLQKIRSKSKTATEIEDDDGNVITDPKKILEVQRKFFSELYDQPVTDQLSDIELLGLSSNDIPQKNG